MARIRPATAAGRRLEDRLRIVHSVYSSEITADIIATETEGSWGAVPERCCYYLHELDQPCRNGAASAAQTRE